jgi:hypothetical protein
VSTELASVGKTLTKKEKLRQRRQKCYAKQLDRKTKLIEWFGNKCKDCKKSFNIVCYDFHHRDPDTKDFALEIRSFSKPWESIIVEASKCDLLCACCHRLRHLKARES